MKIRGSILLPCTHRRRRCTMPSSSLGHSARTPPTTKALLAKGGKITMPVFAIGAEKFFGKGMAVEMGFAASNVTGGIVPNSGHWIMEENPQATIKLVTDFLAK